MSTERDELAEDIRGLGITVMDGPPVDLTEPLAQHLHNLGYRKPRTITTTEELDTLPVGSVVRTRREGIYEKANFHGDPEFPFWIATGVNREFPSLTLTLPATVLHEGSAS